MKTLVPVLLALLVPVAHAQDAKPLSVKQVPLRADAPILFAPRGWKIEKRIGGDLNRDKIADAALVLVENKPAKDSEGDATERKRALVVLLREGKGFRRAGFNNSLLLGTRDGGAFFGVMETPVDVSIKRGVLVISMESGSRDVLETTHKFRLDRRTQRFYLIGFNSSTRDRAAGGGTTLSENYLTGVKKSEIYYGDDEGRTKTSRISRKLRTLESVKDDARGSE